MLLSSLLLLKGTANSIASTAAAGFVGHAAVMRGSMVTGGTDC